jgi:hypothetical protein
LCLEFIFQLARISMEILQARMLTARGSITQVCGANPPEFHH